MGNLDAVELLWRGTLAAVLQAIADAGHRRGFILGSGCEVPMASPREDVKAMIATAHLK